MGQDDNVTPWNHDNAESKSLLPVRMLNEFAYCPRLFHLMHVEGVWEDNHFTIDGKLTHRRIESKDELLPDISHKTSENGQAEPHTARSITLSSTSLGIIGKLDAVVTEGSSATPIETKRGEVPQNAECSYEPERVQLMAQGLLLRENGYNVSHGILYFAGSKRRVEIAFTDELEKRTRELLSSAHEAALERHLPPPLKGSPKCAGCSLNGICLPDETLSLREVDSESNGKTVRRLYSARADQLPLYVQTHGASVGVSGKSLVVRAEGKEIAKVGFKDVSQVVLCANVRISSQAIRRLCDAGLPIVYLSAGNWFYGLTTGHALRSSFTKAAQFAAAANDERASCFAKQVVAAKASNQRTLLRRNGSGSIQEPLKRMASLITKIKAEKDVDALLGLEGNVARIYFELFSCMLRPKSLGGDWDFVGRNRRPPRDPINALLSLAYALLAKECTVALMAEGLDPWWGLFHKPRHGRPALALDLMEEFRPTVADSAVITAINTGMIVDSHFIRSDRGCMMKAEGRKAFLRAYEARLDQLISHPLFDYRCSWRTVIKLQARLLARWLRNDIPEYTGMVVR